MAVQTQIQTRRGTAASWTSTNPTLAAGEIGFETDTGKFKIGNGSTAWASLAYSAGATAVTYLFNATSGQTTFSGADANGLTLAYTVGAEQVYLNGVLQVRGSDYTATNGTSIVLASGALTSDVLNVIAYSAMTITDTYTQAQADAKFFQTANAFLAGKNKIINGDMNIWQRGTSTTLANNTTAFGPDRFVVYTSFSAGSSSFSRQTFTPGTAPVAGYESAFFARLTCGSTATYFEIDQNVEDVRTLAGQTVTLSFWAKASGTVVITPTLNQVFGSGGSGSVSTTGSNQTLTTSWARYSVTVSLPSISGKTIGTNSYLNVALVYASGTINSATIDIWGVQLEAGSIATPFQTATGTLAGELAACQRYYWRQTPGNPGVISTFGIAKSTTSALFSIMSPTTMRKAPDTLDYANIVIYDGVTGQLVSALTLSATFASTGTIISFDATSTSLTQYRSYLLYTNNANGYFGVSAEL